MAKSKKLKAKFDDAYQKMKADRGRRQPRKKSGCDCGCKK